MSILSRNKYCWPAKTSLEVFSYYSFIFYLYFTIYILSCRKHATRISPSDCSLYTIPKDLTIYFFSLFYDNSIIFQSRGVDDSPTHRRRDCSFKNVLADSPTSRMATRRESFFDYKYLREFEAKFGTARR